MPNGYILNELPTGYGQALSLLVEMLVTAGWSFQGSGDGLQGYDPKGKIFKGTGAGPYGWNNSRAWARLQDPAASREICVQHDAASGLRLKYSHGAKFLYGAPSVDTVPSASDERILWGGGTDQEPEMPPYFGTGTETGLVRYQGRANVEAPFGFWMAAAITPAGAIQCGIAMDPVVSVPEDPDPVVWHLGTRLAFQQGGLGQPAGEQHSAEQYPPAGGHQQGCWACMDQDGFSFLYVQPTFYACGNQDLSGGLDGSQLWLVGQQGLGPNPFNGKYEALPIGWLRPNVPELPSVGFKGWGTLMRWTTMARTTFTDLLDAKNWVCVGQVWLPWDGTTDTLP